MRRLFFLFVTVLWIIAGLGLVRNFNREDEGQIVQAFNKTNCMNAISKIQVDGPLMAEYKPIGEQKNILIKIAEAIGISGGYHITEERDEVVTTVQLVKKAAQAETVMKIVTVEDEYSDNVVETIQYLVVEIELYGKLECAMIYKNKLDNIVSEYGITNDVSLQFSGELPGMLSDVEKENLTEQLLKNISAEEVNKNADGELYTVYAYTDLIQEYHQINNKKVNVTIAINYNEETNDTILYLSTPFLKEDY